MSSDAMDSLEQSAVLLLEHGEGIAKLLHDGKLRALEGSRALTCSDELYAILQARQKPDKALGPTRTSHELLHSQ